MAERRVGSVGPISVMLALPDLVYYRCYLQVVLSIHQYISFCRHFSVFMLFLWVYLGASILGHDLYILYFQRFDISFPLRAFGAFREGGFPME